MPLTDIQAKASKPRDRAYKLSDGEGLFLLIQPNGSKLWRMKYRYGGKEKLLSFGPYPRVGIAAAREKRAAAKAILGSGKDPARTQSDADAGEGRTFRAVATENGGAKLACLIHDGWAVGYSARALPLGA